eukprot:TRINITY_DN3939_c0_g1_i5.p1 TRINITY_DN3939_c0_g1~~TRINITY_DN3939_c0_g1_i5.p1  ORF type:complete len:5854 (+),score=1586.94 TRINITY_DN3939_c0_g1_i5:129-17690(+)
MSGYHPTGGREGYEPTVNRNVTFRYPAPPATGAQPRDQPALPPPPPPPRWGRTRALVSPANPDGAAVVGAPVDHIQGVGSGRGHEPDHPPAPMPAQKVSMHCSDDVDHVLSFTCAPYAEFNGTYTRDPGVLVNKAPMWKRSGKQPEMRLYRDQWGRWGFSTQGQYLRTGDVAQIRSDESGLSRPNDVRQWLKRSTGDQWEPLVDTELTIGASGTAAPPAAPATIEDVVKNCKIDELEQQLKVLLQQRAQKWDGSDQHKRDYANACQFVFKTWPARVKDKTTTSLPGRLFDAIMGSSSAGAFHTCLLRLLQLTSAHYGSAYNPQTDTDSCTLRATAVVLAVDCLVEDMLQRRVKEEVPRQLNLDGRIAQARRELYHFCMPVLEEQAGKRNLPGGVWPSLRALGEELRAPHSGSAEHRNLQDAVYDVCFRQGRNRGLTDVIPGGGPGTHIVRILAELGTCVGGRPKATWAFLMSRYHERRLDLLLHCSLARYGSEYAPETIDNASFRMQFSDTADQLTVDGVCALLQHHAAHCDGLFTAREDKGRLAIRTTKACFRYPLQVSQADFVRFCKLAVDLFPPGISTTIGGGCSTTVKELPVALRLQAMLDREDGDMIDALSDAGDDRRTAQFIRTTAVSYIRQRQLTHENVRVLGRVLARLQGPECNLNSYVREKYNSRSPELVVAVMGHILEREQMLDRTQAATMLWDAATARAQSCDEEPPLALLAIVAQDTALSWSARAAAHVRAQLTTFFADWEPSTVYPGWRRMHAADFLATHARSLPKDKREGSELYTLVWELLAERMVISGTASEGRKCSGEPAPHVPTTERPVFDSVNSIDKWLLSHSSQVADMMRTKGTQAWAASTLLLSYLRLTGIPLYHPRAIGVHDRENDMTRLFNIHEPLLPDWEQFKEHCKSAVEALRSDICDGLITANQVNKLHEHDAALAQEIGLDFKRFREDFEEARNKIRQLTVIMKSLEHRWKVVGSKERRLRLEECEANVDNEYLCELLSLVKETEELLPRDSESLERVANSCLFIVHYEGQRAVATAKQKNAEVNIATFKQLLDGVLGQRGTLRGLSPDTPIQHALVTLPSAETGDEYDGLVPPEQRASEKQFLVSEDVRCDPGVADLLVDYAVPLVALVHHLRHFREWANTREPSYLRLHGDFFDGDGGELLRRTIEDIQYVSLKDAPGMLTQLREATAHCPPQALRLIGTVLRYPRVLEFVHQHPETLAPFVNQLLTTSRDIGQVEFQGYTFILTYIMPFVTSSGRFNPADFTGIQGLEPMQRCTCTTFFQQLRALPLDGETGLSAVVQNISTTSNQSVLDRLKGGVMKLLETQQVLEEVCEAFMTSTVEIDMPVTGKPTLTCRYIRAGEGVADDAAAAADGAVRDKEEVMDLSAFKDTLHRATLQDRDCEQLQRFVPVARNILYLYFNACALSDEGHIEFRGRTLRFQVERCHADVAYIVAEFEKIRASWAGTLDKAVDDSPALATLSTAELVRLALLLRCSDGDVLRTGWHIAAGIGSTKSADELKAILREVNGGAQLQAVEMGDDAWDAPGCIMQQVEESTKTLLRGIGKLLEGLVGDVRGVDNFEVPQDSELPAPLQDLSRIEAMQRKPYALSCFRPTELRAQHWLDCTPYTSLEQVKTFARRFTGLHSGRMVVMHFQELSTEAQNVLRSRAAQNKKHKQLLLFVTNIEKASAAAGACVSVNPPVGEELNAIRRKVAAMQRFKSVTYFCSPSGTGKSTAINRSVASLRLDQPPVRIDINAITTMDDVCAKLMEKGPWGMPQGPGRQQSGALILHVGHDAAPDMVNSVLDGLILFGKLVSPSGHSCAASVWGDWHVYVEFQEPVADDEGVTPSWQDRVGLLQITGLGGEGQLVPFQLDLQDPFTGEPLHPGAMEAVAFFRAHYSPPGGWRPHTGDHNVDALRQLISAIPRDPSDPASGGLEPTPRILARAARFLAKRHAELSMFAHYQHAQEKQQQHDVGSFWAKCKVHELGQYLQPSGTNHFHLCARNNYSCLQLGGRIPDDIAADMDRMGIKLSLAVQEETDVQGSIRPRKRAVPLYRLVEMLSAELDVKSTVITDNLLRRGYILTPDFLRKMIQLWQRIELGDPIILEGPSGTGKTCCTEQLAALEPMSERHPHNGLLAKLESFIYKSADLKGCFPEGVENPASGLNLEEVQRANIPGALEECKEELAKCEADGRDKRIRNFLGAVLRCSPWASVHRVLDELSAAAADPAAPIRDIARAVNQIRSALHHALSPHLDSDRALRHSMEEKVREAAQRVPEVDARDNLEAHAALLRTHVRESAEPAAVRKVVGVIKLLTLSLEKVHMSFLSSAVLRILGNRVADVLCEVPGAEAGQMRETLLRDQKREAVAFWAGQVVEGMGEDAPRGIQILVDEMQRLLQAAPLAKPTPRFKELAQTLPAAADHRVLAEIVLEFAKTESHSNHTTILMRFDMEPQELYKKMEPLLKRAQECLEHPSQNASSPLRFVVFIDEMNTSSCMGLLKRIIQDRYWDQWGGPLPANVSFVCAVNPHKKGNLDCEPGAAASSCPTGHPRLTRTTSDEDVNHLHGLLAGRYSKKQIRETLPLFDNNVENTLNYLASETEIMSPEGDTPSEGALSPQHSTALDGGAQDDANKGKGLFFDVNPLPPSELESVVPWEQLYGAGRAIFVDAKLYSNRRLLDEHFSEDQIHALGEIVLTAHDFVQTLLQRIRSRSTVSQRDIHRTFLLFDFFFKRPDACTLAAERNRLTKARDAMLLAAGVSYYFRLSPEHRSALAKRVDQVVRKGGVFETEPLEEILEYVVDKYFKAMGDMPEGIFEHKPLRENLFVQLICFENRLGVVLHGAPGTSKTLSNNIIKDAMTGKTHFMAQFKQICDVVRYQGSKQSTADEIRQKCVQCDELQKRHDQVKDGKLSLLNVDEAGIVHSGNPMGLKVLHYYLGEAQLAAVLMTNDPLDPAVSNRCVEVLLTEPTPDELENIACGIVRVPGKPEPELTRKIIRACSKAYYGLKGHRKLGGRLKRWFGLRDFYHLIRFFRRWEEFEGGFRRREGREVTITPRLLLHALERNFNGDSSNMEKGKRRDDGLFDAVMESFQKECEKVQWPAFTVHQDGDGKPNLLRDPSKRRNTLEVITDSLADNNRARGDNLKNLSDMWVRFKLLVDETPDGSLLSLLQDCGLQEFKDIQVLSLSALSSDELMPVTVVSQIAAAMEAGKTVWLTNTRAIDGALFDLFNQSYTCCCSGGSAGKERKMLSFVPLSIGGLVQYKRVDPDFQIIVHVTREEAKSDLPSPFLNRLEKFPVSVADVLDYRMQQLSGRDCEQLKWLQKRCTTFVECISQKSRTVFSADVSATIDSICLGCVGEGNDGEGVSLVRDVAPPSVVEALTRAGAHIPPDVADPDSHHRWRACVAAVLQITRPEGILLAASALEKVPQYLNAYFNYLSPCSLRRHLGRLLDECRRDHDDHWARCMVHLPANTDFMSVLKKMSDDGPEVNLVEFDTIGSADHFLETIRGFAADRLRRVLVVIVGDSVTDVALREVRQLMHDRPSDRDGSDGTGSKAVVLLRSFRPAFFEVSCTPLFASGWEQVYIDAAADVEGVKLAEYAALTADPPEVTDELFNSAQELALRSIEQLLPKGDRLRAIQGEGGAVSIAAKFYTDSCTMRQRAAALSDLFRGYPLSKGALVDHYRSVMGEQQREHVQALAAKVCSRAETGNLAELLLNDRRLILATIIRLGLSPLLEDFNMVRMLKIKAQQRGAADRAMAEVLKATHLGGNAEELRRRDQARSSQSIAVEGTVPYMPGFCSVARLLRVDRSKPAVDAAEELRQEWEPKVQQGEGAGRVLAEILRSPVLLDFFEKDCVRECLRHVPPAWQDLIVDATLELVRGVHAGVFDGQPRTLWSVRALCACESSLIEAHALGLLPLAESKAFGPESIKELRRIIEGRPQGQLQAELAIWARDLLVRRLQKATAEDAQKWCRAVQALLLHGADERRDTLLTSDPAAASVAVAAAAVHAKPTTAVLKCAKELVAASLKLPPPHIDNGALEKLCAVDATAAQAAVLQLVQLSSACARQHPAVGRGLREEALRQCAAKRLSRAMAARIVVEAGFSDRVPPAEDLQMLWRLAGGGDEIPTDFRAADGPLRNPLYQALFDIIFEQKSAEAGCEAIANGRQRASRGLDDAHDQRDAPAAAFRAVELAAAEDAYIDVLGAAFAGQNGHACIPQQERATHAEMSTARHLFEQKEHRLAFLAAVRRATTESGGANAFLARFMHPEAAQHLRELHADMGPICDGARQLGVRPGDWACAFDPQSGLHAVTADLDRAVFAARGGADAEGAPAAAGGAPAAAGGGALLTAAVRRAQPHGLGKAASLLAHCAQRARYAGKALSLEAASEELVQVLDLSPVARKVLEFSFVGTPALAALPACGLVEDAPAGGVYDEWQVASGSVLAAALSLEPGTMMHSMLFAPDALMGTLIAGDKWNQTIGQATLPHRGYLDCVTVMREEGQVQYPPPDMSAGSCYLLWFVEFTLLAFGSVINPPQRPNTDSDTLWRYVFSRVADDPSNDPAADPRRRFVDFIVSRSRACFLHLCTRTGLGTDAASRLVAVLCEQLVSKTPELGPLQQKIDTSEKRQAAEVAIEAFWRRMTKQEREKLTLPADQVCDTLRIADEEVTRRSRSRLPRESDALRLFQADGEAQQQCPVLRTVYNEERVLKRLPPLFVRLAHLHAWVHTTLSGLISEEDYSRPLRHKLELFDERRRRLGCMEGVPMVQLLLETVRAWNDYQKDVGPIRYECNEGAIGFELTEDVGLGQFLSLPPDARIGDQDHSNHIAVALQVLPQIYNKLVAEAAGGHSAEEYGRKHMHLHPLLLPPYGGPLMLTITGNLQRVCRSYFRGPGDVDWTQAELEERRHVGDDLPLMLSLPPPGEPGATVFAFYTECKDAVSTESARALRAALRNPPRHLCDQIPGSDQLRRRFHPLCCRAVTAMAAALLKLLGDPQSRMRAKRPLKELLGPALSDSGADDELRDQLLDSVDGVKVSHLRDLSTMFAVKLENHDWEWSDLPCEIAVPFTDATMEDVQRRLRNWTEMMQEAPEGASGVHEELQEFETYLSNGLRNMRGKANAAEEAGKSISQWLQETLLGEEWSLVRVFDGVKVANFVPLLRLVQGSRRQAEEACRKKRPGAVAWQERGEDVPETPASPCGGPQSNWWETDAAPEVVAVTSPAAGPAAPPAAPPAMLQPVTIGGIINGEYPGVPPGSLREMPLDSPLHNDTWVAYWLDGLGNVAFSNDRSGLWYHHEEFGFTPVTVGAATQHSEWGARILWSLQQVSTAVQNGAIDEAERILMEAQLPFHMRGLAQALFAAYKARETQEQGMEGGEEWDHWCAQLGRAVDEHREVKAALPDWPNYEPASVERAMVPLIEEAARRCCVLISDVDLAWSIDEAGAAQDFIDPAAPGALLEYVAPCKAPPDTPGDYARVRQDGRDLAVLASWVRKAHPGAAPAYECRHLLSEKVHWHKSVADARAELEQHKEEEMRRHKEEEMRRLEEEEMHRQQEELLRQQQQEEMRRQQEELLRQQQQEEMRRQQEQEKRRQLELLEREAEARRRRDEQERARIAREERERQERERLARAPPLHHEPEGSMVSDSSWLPFVSAVDRENARLAAAAAATVVLKAAAVAASPPPPSPPPAAAAAGSGSSSVEGPSPGPPLTTSAPGGHSPVRPSSLSDFTMACPRCKHPCFAECDCPRAADDISPDDSVSMIGRFPGAGGAAPPRSGISSSGRSGAAKPLPSEADGNYAEVAHWLRDIVKIKKLPEDLEAKLEDDGVDGAAVREMDAEDKQQLEMFLGNLGCWNSGNWSKLKGALKR